MDSLQEVLQENGGLSDEQRKNLCDARQILGCVEEHDLLETRMAMTGGIYNYYVQNRGVGHTRVMRQGIEEANKPADSFDASTKVTVVVATQREGNQFPGFNTITLDQFKAGDMLSKRGPLAWDNSAIVRLVSMMSIVRGTFRRIRHIVEETTGNGD